MLRRSSSLIKRGCGGWRRSQRSRVLSTTTADVVSVHEVSARDGIQNEKTLLSVDQRLELIRRVVAINPSSVEVASFVRPDLVPAMAQSDELCQRLQELDWAQEARSQGMGFAALIPNARGYENFQQALAPVVTVGQDQVVNVVVAFTSCTDAHSRANVLTPMHEALQNTCELIKTAKADGRSIQAYASMAFYCPYEGAVDPKNVATVIEGYVEAGADKIILADTLGQALPSQITETLAVAVEAGASMEQLGLHLHDAHHKAHANVIAAIEAGVRHFDCATSGCGGCNFVPDAEGNISIQTLLWAINNTGCQAAVGAPENIQAVHDYLSEVLGKELNGTPLVPDS